MEDILNIVNLLSGIIALLAFFGITHYKQLGPSSEPSTQVTQTNTLSSSGKRANLAAVIAGGMFFLIGLFTGGVIDAIMGGVGGLAFGFIIGQMSRALYAAIGGAIFTIAISLSLALFGPLSSIITSGYSFIVIFPGLLGAFLGWILWSMTTGIGKR